MLRRRLIQVSCWVAFTVISFPIQADDWRGYVSAEARLFPHSAADPEQHGDNLSFAAEPEYYREWDDGRRSFSFIPFARLDQGDSDRSHFDVRELLWQWVGQSWELRAGIGKVFWGVAETRHLVDIINQTDAVENIDLEDKLGQPMVDLALIRDWGTVDLFILPGFRERTFPGPDGRLRSQPPVKTSRTRYESAAKKKHVDWAVRWAHSIGDWDIGTYYFNGTSREPLLLPEVNAIGELELIPFYEQLQQFGLDVQATKGDWLWKLEAIAGKGKDDRFGAVVGGFEYTLVGLLETRADLGLLVEYLYDDRGDNAPTPFQDDVFLGARITPNDAQSTEFLFGIFIDPDNGTRTYNLETSRRIGSHWKLSIEARIFSNIPKDDLLFSFRDDDYLQVELARYF
ncbi:MAG: hypothetical protein V3R51_04385 [Gammaproteobacteria bacterium]